MAARNQHARNINVGKHINASFNFDIFLPDHTK